jgi:hypothetical protein
MHISLTKNDDPKSINLGFLQLFTGKSPVRCVMFILNLSVLLCDFPFHLLSPLNRALLLCLSKQPSKQPISLEKCYTFIAHV